MRVAMIMPALAGILLLAQPVTAAGPKYRVTSLAAQNLTQSFSINNLGEVSGYHRDGSIYTNWLYDGTTNYAIGLAGTPGSPGSQSALNNNGAVALTSQGHAALYDGTLHDIGPAGLTSHGLGINDAGEVVGYSVSESGDHYDAFLYDGTTTTTLDIADGAIGVFARDINNAGQIVGDIDDADDSDLAFLYDGNSTTLLGTLGGSFSEAYAINDDGDVVGNSTTAGDTAGVAFLYRDGVMTNLGMLDGFGSLARAINSQGVVVGDVSYFVGPGNAFIYTGGTMHNLNDDIDPSLGIQLYSARGINDLGQIVAMGVDSHGATVSYLLTPVPEPASWATMVVGFGLLGAAARRRRAISRAAPRS